MNIFFLPNSAFKTQLSYMTISVENHIIPLLLNFDEICDRHQHIAVRFQ